MIEVFYSQNIPLLSHIIFVMVILLENLSGDDDNIIFDIATAVHVLFILAKERTPIKVTLRDGKIVDGLAWKTTPYEIAASIRYELNCFLPLK